MSGRYLEQAGHAQAFQIRTAKLFTETIIPHINKTYPDVVVSQVQDQVSLSGPADQVAEAQSYLHYKLKEAGYGGEEQ